MLLFTHIDSARCIFTINHCNCCILVYIFSTCPSWIDNYPTHIPSPVLGKLRKTRATTAICKAT